MCRSRLAGLQSLTHSPQQPTTLNPYSPYSKTRNNPGLIFEIGWGPGCGVGGPGGGFLNVNRSGGVPPLLFPLKPPPGPPTAQPGPQPMSKIMTLARLFRFSEYHLDREKQSLLLTIRNPKNAQVLHDTSSNLGGQIVGQILDQV